MEPITLDSIPSPPVLKYGINMHGLLKLLLLQFLDLFIECVTSSLMYDPSFGAPNSFAARSFTAGFCRDKEELIYALEHWFCNQCL